MSFYTANNILNIIFILTQFVQLSIRKYLSACLLLIIVITIGASCNLDAKRQIPTDGSSAIKVIPEPKPELDREDWQRPGFVVSKLGDLTNKTVADLGAGLGFFLVYLVPKSKKVIALDIDESATQWLTLVKSQYPTDQQGKIDIRLVEPADPKLAKDEVDVVLVVNTITFIENRVPYLRKLRESIKRHGIIQIVDFKLEEIYIEAPAIEERVDPETIVKELQEAGFQIIEKDYTSLNFQYLIIASDPD